MPYDPFALPDGWVRPGGRTADSAVDEGGWTPLDALMASTGAHDARPTAALSVNGAVASPGRKRPREAPAASVSARVRNEGSVGGARSAPSPPGTILGAAPPDDRVICIADFIATQFTDGEVEIEAKLGTLIDLSTQQRARIPSIATAACVLPELNTLTRFESTVSADAFKRLNAALNSAAEATTRRSGRPVRYQRRREVDCAYTSDVRETRPQGKTSAEPTSLFVRKTRLDQMHLVFPQHPYDVRVSASREERLPPPAADAVPAEWGARKSERHKDRLSYQSGCLSVDITVVQQPPTNVITYEVEVEVAMRDGAMADAAALLRACADYRARRAAAASTLPLPPPPLAATAQTLFDTVVALNWALS